MSLNQQESTMNDPHVQTLRFRLRTQEDTSYKQDAAPVIYETTAFKATLENGMLIMSMKEHFTNSGAAFSRVQKYLRSWEVLAGVNLGPGNLRFEFDGAEIIDLAPTPGGSQLVSDSAAFGITMSGISPTHVVMNQYPAPPTKFLADPIAEVLWKRYARFKRDGEPLTSMGYFCLSVIQADAGNRKKASVKFVIHIDVLDKLGELTSDAGDDTEARKRDNFSTYLPLTEKQRTWIEAAVRMLIIRVGEFAANPTAGHKQITMADLPGL